VLGGLKESVFRVEMYRERKELRVQDWDTSCHDAEGGMEVRISK
jgi:hypothetical protein